MSNLDLLRGKMHSSGVSALLVSHNDSIGWLTGFTGSFARVVVTPDRALFVTDSRYTIQAQEQVAGIPVVSFASPIDGDEFVGEQVLELGIHRIGFESANATYSTWERWTHKFAAVELFPVADLFGALRMIKTPEEVEKIRAACAITDAAFEHVCRLIRPGMSEFDLGLELEFFIRRQGADIAFDPIVVSGNRSARPHGRASEKLLEVGDFLTLDFGAKFNGYNSDITRTVIIGQASDRHREIYEQVLKAETSSMAAMKPGVRASAVDKLSRDILNEKDLAQYFGHGLGHGLGKLVHDSGRMNPTSEDVLAVGQVWTVEPGVYIEGFGGCRIEDDVVVTETGVHVLTRATKEMLVLPRA